MNEKKNLTLEEIFALAVQNHRKNNLQVAKKLYKKVLNINSNDLQSNFLLGTLSAQTKQFHIAKKLLNRSIEINPNYADAHNNLGIVLQQLGEHQKAKSNYEKAITIKPNYTDAHNNLGNVLKELGEHQKAISSYENAIQINPNYADAHYNLGNVLKELGYHQKAISSYEKAIQINPNYASAYNNLANVLKELGEHQKAISSYEKAITIKPNYTDAHNNLGNVLNELGEHQKAISSYENAIQINQNYADAHYNLGNVLKELGYHQKAISSYEKAIQINPNYVSAYNNLANVLKELGEHQKAKNFYQIAVKYEPENLDHLYNLSRLDEEVLQPNLKNKIYKIIEKNNSTKKNIAYGNFLLSRYELKAKKYKNEFDHLLKGHQYFFESEKKKFKKEVEYLFNVFSKRKELINLNLNNKNVKIDNHIIKPIFIIGVPRCGSTLIEKIIASGSQYIPIGEETGIIHTSVQNLINQKQLLNSDIDQFQTKIVDTYRQKGLVQEESNYMFTDKSLANFFYIYIIKEIFPQAKVINCRRNAISSIMSTLKNNLVTLPWAHNLEHIFKYHDIYYQMIKNFEKTHSNFIYDLQYEKFVSDPENETKKLMKFCGLTWNIKCLEFYKRRDLISKTASNIQIRKAIYKDSINKYLPYKQFLSKYGNKYSWFN